MGLDDYSFRYLVVWAGNLHLEFSLGIGIIDLDEVAAVYLNMFFELQVFINMNIHWPYYLIQVNIKGLVLV